MNNFIIVLFSFFLSFSSYLQRDTNEDLKEIISCGPEATCYGNNPCRACKSCNYCSHCNLGGSCGVCATPKKKIYNTPTRYTPAKISPSQCKAITKKKKRCQRSASYKGYCWQHG